MTKLQIDKSEMINILLILITNTCERWRGYARFIVKMVRYFHRGEQALCA